ncbi:MAG TPA: hypothetical protein VMH91_02845 [Candidatus Paceibacterota bacterium]|nr:hypothetical protein [Candidatus Paceibacterota bacterium]
MPEGESGEKKILPMELPYSRRENESLTQHKSRITRYIKQNDLWITEYNDALKRKDLSLAEWKRTLAELESQLAGSVTRQDIKERLDSVQNIVSEDERGREQIIETLERLEASRQDLIRFRRTLDAKAEFPEKDE